MKESYGEGLAPHTGPESCVYGRKVVGEALTGAHTGQPSSSEIASFGMPTPLSEAEGNIGDGAMRKPLPDPALSENLCTCENSLNGNREIPQSPCPIKWTGRSGKATSRKPDMHACGKSDGFVVPGKSLNKDRRNPTAEAMEGRRPPKGNTFQMAMSRTQCRKYMSPGLQRVRKVARIEKGVRFTSLMHHVTLETLKESYSELKRKAAPGVDGVTWSQYQEGSEERLKDLLTRVLGGTYRSQPSKRIYIPKPDGRMRPIGIAALEDKIVQHAVGNVLSAIYEEDFLGFSYGFRPERSQHDALDALSVGLNRKKVSWVLDADIQGFFDTIDHQWMSRFIEHRVADPRMLRLIRKWLRAGVSEDGQWSKTEIGTPQGAVISPLLANIYLHYVLDLWLHSWRQKSAKGDVIIIRYADDFVVGFQYRHEAESFLDALKARLVKFGLTLHSAKTRLIEFGRFAASNREERGKGRPETFDFLGFTHICTTTRIQKRFHVWRKTVKKRLRASLAKVRAELRVRKHDPVREVGAWLRTVTVGYFQYHAIPGNWAALNTFRAEIARYWIKCLRGRGQKRRMNWKTFQPLIDHWIPLPTLKHPYPSQRFDAKHPREEPGAVVPLAGIRAGGAG